MAAATSPAAGGGLSFSPAARLVVGLAWRDLRHEWVLTLTVVLAIAAVLAPLLLLLGLKHGTIEYNLRLLVQDPVNRAIVPERGDPVPEAVIAAWQARPDVAFIVPNILPGVSTVSIERDGGQVYRLDTLPSGPGDPLLLANGAPAPGEGQAVLSATAADRLELAPGGTLVVLVTRENEGRSERQTVELEIVGVLPARADELERLYVPFPLLEDIETYRRGEAVASRDWPGDYARPSLTFDGLILSLGGDVPAQALLRTTSGTGFANRRDLPPTAVAERLGVDVAPDRRYVELKSVGNPVGPVNLRTVTERLREFDVLAFPFVEGVSAKYENSPFVPLQALDLAEGRMARAGFAAPPWGEPARDAAGFTIHQVLVPTSWNVAAGSTIAIETRVHGRSLTLPVEVAGTSPGNMVAVPAAMAGILRSVADQTLVWDPDLGALKRTKDGYRGFRLYARTIEDVALLAEHLEKTEGIPVITRAGRIEQVKRMEAALTRLFWLVAVVGIVGGVAALAASLWAAVERKRRDIGLLRLFGLTRRALFGFPLSQAAMIAVAAALVAVAAFLTLATVINAVFAVDLPLGEKLCTLPPSHLFYAVLLTLVTAVASALMAARLATSIDPAEAIREE